VNLPEQTWYRHRPDVDAYVVFGCFRVFNKLSLVWLWLPNSRFVLGITRTVRFSTPRLPDLQEFSRSESSSPALRRHLSVYSSSKLPSYRCSMSTMNHPRKAPHKAFNPSAFPDVGAPFSPFAKRPRDFALSLGDSVYWVWLPI